jgi:hypothetical protein
MEQKLQPLKRRRLKCWQKVGLRQKSDSLLQLLTSNCEGFSISVPSETGNQQHRPIKKNLPITVNTFDFYVRFHSLWCDRGSAIDVTNDDIFLRFSCGSNRLELFYRCSQFVRSIISPRLHMTATTISQHPAQRTNKHWKRVGSDFTWFFFSRKQSYSGHFLTPSNGRIRASVSGNHAHGDGGDTYARSCDTEWWQVLVPPLWTLIRPRRTKKAIFVHFVTSKWSEMCFDILQSCKTLSKMIRIKYTNPWRSLH